MPRYFNFPHSKVGNVNINWTALTFFVYDPVDAMYATADLFLQNDGRLLYSRRRMRRSLKYVKRFWVLPIFCKREQLGEFYKLMGMKKEDPIIVGPNARNAYTILLCFYKHVSFLIRRHFASFCSL